MIRVILGFVGGVGAGALVVAGIVASRPAPPPCPAHPAQDARLTDLEARVQRVAPGMLPPR